MPDGLPRRMDVPVLRTLGTRWMDQDVYGHVNNVVHYSFGLRLEAGSCTCTSTPRTAGQLRFQRLDCLHALLP